jgi:SNF2 family DNA or RNA helicase
MQGRQVQAAIAAHVLGPIGTSERLGDVTLHQHQRDGADRALHLQRAFGGALIADDVGLGKTYLALAVAREFRSPVVVAPAALRGTWIEASARARVPVVILSLEAGTTSSSWMRHITSAIPPRSDSPRRAPSVPTCPLFC